MKKPINLLVASGLLVASMNLIAAPSFACSANLGKHETIVQYREAKLKKIRPIIGNYAEVSRSISDEELAKGDYLWGATVKGLVTTSNGLTFDVQFTDGGLVDDSACGVFRLPADGAVGDFYLKRKGRNDYKLIHWQSKESDKQCSKKS